MFGNFFNKFIPCGRIKRLGRSDLPENEDNAPFLFDDVYKNGTRGEKKQANARQYGRSMVEMLGVLAIIGVLSVGGLAGYNKAMLKYRLNRQAAAINQLLHYAIELTPKLQNSDERYTDHNALFHQLKLIPEGMFFKNDVIFDDFNNQITLLYSQESDTYSLRFVYKQSDLSFESCKNISVTAKENAALLYRFILFKSSDPSTSSGNFRGNAYCSKGDRCLANITLNEISELCRACDDSGCYLFMSWK